MKRLNQVIIDIDNKEIIVPSSEVQKRLEGGKGLRPQTLDELYNLSSFNIVRKSSNSSKRGDSLKITDIENYLNKKGNEDLIKELKKRRNAKDNFFTIKKWFYEVCPEKRK